MEDFYQLSERLTEEKYKSSYERCAKIISQYSSNIGLDSAELFYRLLFCFVTGNSDMHLKNFSLIEAEPKSRNFVLSPAYDLLPVTIVMPEDTEEFALTMNGKRANIRKADFLTFAQSCKIPEKAAYKMINKLLSLKEKLLTVVADSFICEGEKSSFMSLMTERMNRLS